MLYRIHLFDSWLLSNSFAHKNNSSNKFTVQAVKLFKSGSGCGLLISFRWQGISYICPNPKLSLVFIVFIYNSNRSKDRRHWPSTSLYVNNIEDDLYQTILSPNSIWKNIIFRIYTTFTFDDWILDAESESESL